MSTKIPVWFIYALITTIFWGIWGAIIEIPEKSGFPATLGYVVWAITMVPCALVALKIINWKLETDIKSIILGSIIGIFGAGGQLLLFKALEDGPAYIIFPVISLYPVLTIALSLLLLKEKANARQKLGIVIALLAIGLLSYQEKGDSAATGFIWLILSILVFTAWGLQAYFMKFSNQSMKAESIFFYMMITGLLLTPVALYMTDFSQEINLRFSGPYLAFMIHILNAVGALTLVYALRYGKAIIVVPLTGLSPVITIVLSLIIYGVFPSMILGVGLILAVIAIFLLSD
ncbi:MAG: putative membrane protein [Cyclobacteriaceae bacterium]|jgi:uncharacterized membrane protein